MSETIEKTFTVSSPARLNLSNIRGSVEIRPGDEGVIQVTAVKQTGSGDARRTEIELSQDADGTVKVATHFPDAGWGWLIGSFPCRVDYVVRAPRRCSLNIKGVSNETFAGGFVRPCARALDSRQRRTSMNRFHTTSGAEAALE